MTKKSLGYLLGTSVLVTAAGHVPPSATYFLQTDKQISFPSWDVYGKVLSLEVPKGDWIVETKVVVGGSASNPGPVYCGIFVDTKMVDRSYTGLPGTGYLTGATISNRVVISTKNFVSSIILACENWASDNIYIDTYSNMLVRSVHDLK